MQEKAFPNRFIVSDLTNIKEFTTDALIAMIAYANDPSIHRGATIQGKLPVNRELLEKILDSGLYGATLLSFSDGLRPAHGSIFRVNDRSVQGKFAKELIEFSTTKIFGEPRRLKGVYTTMIECMNNTFNHARAGGGGQQVWWATVYCDMQKKVAFFNFLDLGIGILESINVRFGMSLLRFAGLIDNVEVFSDVLEGKIGSRTRLSYRGNGLPEIVKRFKRGQFENLIIISNDVYANLETNEYRLLPKPFQGTFFHWEIHYDRHYNDVETDD